MIVQLRLILEFCDGGSLADVLGRGGFFDGNKPLTFGFVRTTLYYILCTT